MADGESHFEEGTVELSKLEGTAPRSRSWDAAEVNFVESPAGSSIEWHCDPARHYVITLGGRLEFETWRLTDDQPWRHAYITLA